MDLVARARNILFNPKTEWNTIASEETSTADLYRRYIMPLAAIGPIASFIGLALVGVNMPPLGYYRMSFAAGLAYAILSYALALIGLYVIALIINALAPTFSGQKNAIQALKAAAYAYTPGWLASVLHIIPMLGILVLLASLYGLYLLYLGLPVLMKVPGEKALGYTALVVIFAIVVSIVIGTITATIVGIGYPAGSQG